MCVCACHICESYVSTLFHIIIIKSNKGTSIDLIRLKFYETLEYEELDGRTMRTSNDRHIYTNDDPK